MYFQQASTLPPKSCLQESRLAVPHRESLNAAVLCHLSKGTFMKTFLSWGLSYLQAGCIAWAHRGSGWAGQETWGGAGVSGGFVRSRASAPGSLGELLEQSSNTQQQQAQLEVEGCRKQLMQAQPRQMWVASLAGEAAWLHLVAFRVAQLYPTIQYKHTSHMLGFGSLGFSSEFCTIPSSLLAGKLLW